MTSSSSGLFGNFGQTNYAAAKMGVVGLMNTLKLEGAKYNVHTNSIAPTATTRMTEHLFPAEFAEKLDPKYIIPAVIFQKEKHLMVKSLKQVVVLLLIHTSWKQWGNTSY